MRADFEGDCGPAQVRGIWRTVAPNAALICGSSGAPGEVTPSRLGVELGFTGVLHTWIRQFVFCRKPMRLLGTLARSPPRLR